MFDLFFEQPLISSVINSIYPIQLYINHKKSSPKLHFCLSFILSGILIVCMSLVTALSIRPFSLCFSSQLYRLRIFFFFVYCTFNFSNLFATSQKTFSCSYLNISIFVLLFRLYSSFFFVISKHLFLTINKYFLFEITSFS